MTGNALELFSKFFGAVRANFWFCGSFLAPEERLYTLGVSRLEGPRTPVPSVPKLLQNSLVFDFVDV